MDFSLSDEQVSLQQSVAAMLAKHSSMETVREICLDGNGLHETLWQLFTGDLGLTGLAVDEERGGAGAGLVELCVVQEQVGRHLAPVPYLSTVLAALVLERHGSSTAKAKYLPAVTEKAFAAAVNLTPGDAPAIRLEKDGETYRASGVLDAIVDGHAAGLLITPAQLEGRTVLAAVELDESTDRQPLAGMDPTRVLADIRLSSAPATLVTEDEGAAELRDARYLGGILLAAEQIGASRAALELSVEYAGLREQFGRPIGSNQAIKHRCADMFVAIESAWSATYYAAWTADNAPDQLPEAATVARLVTAESSRFATASAIQVHGGIGFTWEHDAHFFVKRAKSSALLLGDPHGELDGLAASLLATH